MQDSRLTGHKNAPDVLAQHPLRYAAAGMVDRLLGRLRRLTYKNSSRVHMQRVNEAFARSVPAGARVLDAGAGSCPYRELFDHAVYESADLQGVDKPYGEITYCCDLRNIPVEDGTFDFILFNQTLEHMAEPQAALKELARVLKPGGRLLCTAPLFYEEHEAPHDYFRFTQFAHRYLFEEAGFEIERLEWLEGYLGTLAHQLDRAAIALPYHASAYGLGASRWLMPPTAVSIKLLFTLLSGLMSRLDARHRFTDAGYPKNYVVVARRLPEPATPAT